MVRRKKDLSDEEEEEDEEISELRALDALRQLKSKFNAEDEDDEDDNYEGEDVEEKEEEVKKKTKVKDIKEKFEEKFEQQKQTFKNKVSKMEGFAEALKELEKIEGVVESEIEKNVWYEIQLPLKNVSLAEMARFDISRQRIDYLYNEAAEILRTAAEKKSTAKSWVIKKVESDGTFHDRLNSLGMKLSTKSPVYQLKEINELVGHCLKRKNRTIMKIAINVTNALWVDKLLPHDRQLKEFSAQPFVQLPTDKDNRNMVLTLWYFEDQLKKLFASYVLKALGGGLADQYSFVKSHLIGKLYYLLSHLHEQEASMLAMLIDKMGDQDKQIAAKSLFFLTNFIKEHRQMMDIVVQETERFIFRNNNRIHAKFFAIRLLVSLPISVTCVDLGNKLLSLYVPMFRQVIGENEVEHRIVNALLKGIKKIITSLGRKANIEKYTETIFTIALEGQFTQRIHALSVLYQMMECGLSDIHTKYYKALYRAMLTLPHYIPKSDKIIEYFSLVFKSISYEKDMNCIMNIVLRLLEGCLQQTPTFVCGAIFMISEVCKGKPHLMDIISNKTKEDNKNEKSNKKEKTKSKEAKEEEQKPVNNETNDEYKSYWKDPYHPIPTEEKFWLLESLTHHYHPSIVQFSYSLLTGKILHYRGNPLQDFTLSAFIDQFVTTKKQTRKPTSRSRPNYFSSSFSQMPQDRVQVDELFFHKYAKLKGISKRKPEEEPDLSEEDDESADEEKLDPYENFNFNDINETEIGGEDNENYDDFDDFSDEELDPELAALVEKKAKNRAEKRALARENEEWDVTRSRKDDDDAEDFDRLISKSRKEETYSKQWKKSNRGKLEKKGKNNSNNKNNNRNNKRKMSNKSNRKNKKPKR